MKLNICSGLEAKQPNSAIRKGVRVQLVKNGKKIACFVPNDGCLNFVDENVSIVKFVFNLNFAKFTLKFNVDMLRLNSNRMKY